MDWTAGGPGLKIWLRVKKCSVDVMENDLGGWYIFEVLIFSFYFKNFNKVSSLYCLRYHRCRQIILDLVNEYLCTLAYLILSELNGSALLAHV